MRKTTHNRKQETGNRKQENFLAPRFTLRASPARSADASRGFTLFYALLVTSLLLALGLAVFNITLKELLLSSDARESQNAFYAADAALECALYWDRSTTPAFGFYGDSLASGLQGYWTFNEDSGDTVYDYSRLSTNHGTLSYDDDDGAFLYDGPERVSGKSGDALDFEGNLTAGDYVSLEESTSASGDFTISAWVSLDGVIQNQFLFSGLSDAGTSPGTRFGFQNSSGVLRHIIQINGGTSNAYALDTGLFGAFHHFVWRRIGTNVELIIDDVLVTTFTNKGGAMIIQEMGRNINTVGGYYNGLIDDVRVYNRALSNEEITALVSGVPNPTFVSPLPQESGVMCAGMDISSPVLGWDSESGWDVLAESEAATTTFDLLFNNGRCALVEVAKDTSTTTIVSRGYNTCEENDARRVERALQATY